MISPAQASSSWSLGGRAVAARLREDRRELVDQVLARVRTPNHPDHHRAAQLRWIAGHNLDLIAWLLDHPDGIDALQGARTSDLMASAANRAAEGAQLESLLQDYTLGTAALLDALGAHAEADDIDDLLQLTQFILVYLREVLTYVVRGFEQENHRIEFGLRDARFALFTALMSGTDTTAAVAQLGTSPVRRYLVLQLRWQAPGESSLPSDLRQVPHLRQAHDVRRVLDQLAVGEVLAMLRPGGGTALVPMPPRTPSETAEVRDVVAQLSRSLGADVRAGAVLADPAEVPAAAVLAQEVLELVLATRGAPGAWFLEDVLVPYQLTRPGPARDLLAERLRGLDGNPEWEQTLRAYLDAGHDRRRAAEMLHVHPNTVDYRLGRIAAVCGINAIDPAHRPAALAALCIRDLQLSTVQQDPS